jgi:hypothetical protein
LEAAGAEFLVLGHLLIEGIHGSKSYTRFPGYDIMAVDAGTQRNCRIQVKSRWATDFDRGFPVSNFEFGFAVLVALNRGYRYRQKPKSSADGRKPPEFYVIPVEVARKAQVAQGTWHKVFLSKIPDHEQYRDAWHLIREFLKHG